MTEVLLPQLGENVTKATVSYWFFQEGDKVTEKEDLVEFTTDKATFNLPSPCSGTLTKIKHSEGDTVNVGDVLALIE